METRFYHYIGLIFSFVVMHAIKLQISKLSHKALTLFFFMDWEILMRGLLGVMSFSA